MKLTVKRARLAFPVLWTPQKVNGEGQPAFGAALLVPPTHPIVKELEKAFPLMAQEKWGSKAKQVLDLMKKTDKTCLHDGDTKSNYEGYAGNMFIQTRSKVRPSVVNRDRSPLTEADGVVYSGCYVTALIELWAQDNKFGKRINAQLRGIQYFGDGDPFTGGAAPAGDDEFEDLSTEEAEFDPAS